MNIRSRKAAVVEQSTRMKTKSPQTQSCTTRVLFGLLIGGGVGAAIGVALDNIGIGIGIGAGVGILFAFASRKHCKEA